MGGCHSDNSENTNREIKRVKTVLNKMPEFFSKKGEKLTDLKGYEDTPSQNIELFLFLKDVDFALYEIEVFLRTGSIDSFLGKSKETEGKNVDFMTSFTLNYYFEKEQIITLRVNKNKNKLEVLSTTIGKIMGSIGQRTVIPIHYGGNLAIQAQNVKNDKFFADIGVTLNISQSLNIEPYYMIKRDISIKDNTQFVNTYKSEVMSHSIKNSYVFNKVGLETSVLNDNNNDKAFVIEVYDAKKMEIIGFQSIVINQFNQNNNFRNKYQLISAKSKQLLSTHYLDVNINLTEKYRFIDYLSGGLQISLIIGIDFTSSNKPIYDPSSLHYIQPNIPNGYEKAIVSCGNIIAYYDYDQLFPVFGYGAKLPGKEEVNHCFTINNQIDPNIFTINNVLIAYRDCVQNIRMFGPTFFSPIIRETINISKNNHKDVYHILMILTDGLINDIGDTIDALVEASFLPISVIIIGIGKGKFENMEILDADINPLKSSTGVQAARDIVQFVEFRLFENDGVKLAEQVLEEVPSQVEEYFKLIKKPPNKPVHVD